MPEVAPYRARSAVALFIAGCAVLFAAWKNAPIEPPPPSPAEVAEYYQKNVASLIEAAARRDREATGVAIQRLHEHFKSFHAGIPAFADDITGWGTRFGIVGRSVKDLWSKFWEDSSKATATTEYVNTKFRLRIVSEEKLRHAVADTLSVFHESTTANRNRMLAEVRLAFSMPESPMKVMPPGFNGLLSESRVAAGELASTQGGASVANGVASFAGGTVAGEAAARLISAIFARFAASTAATIAAEGSAAAGATATGGTVGTAGGPAGTVIGIGVGLVVGFIMDSWMSESFKTKLHEQCGGFLTNLERDIIHGTAATPGLQKTLEDAASANHSAFRTALERELTLP